MKTFKEFLNESNNKMTRGDGFLFSENISTSQVQDIIHSIYGVAKGAGTGSASTAQVGNPNRYMEFKYGFSESTMNSYFKLNDKNFSKLDDIRVFTDIIRKHGTTIEGFILLKFDKGLVSLGDDNDLSYFYSVSAYEKATRNFMDDEEREEAIQAAKRLK